MRSCRASYRLLALLRTTLWRERRSILLKGCEIQGDETRKAEEGSSDARARRGGLGILRRTRGCWSVVLLGAHYACPSRHRCTGGIRYDSAFLLPEVRLNEPYANRRCVPRRCGGIRSLFSGAGIRKELHNVLQRAGNLDTFRFDIRSNLFRGQNHFLQITGADSEQIG